MPEPFVVAAIAAVSFGAGTCYGLALAYFSMRRDRRRRGVVIDLTAARRNTKARI